MKSRHHMFSFSPFRFTEPSVTVVHGFLFAVLVPEVLMLIYTQSYLSLLLLLASSLGGLLSGLVKFKLQGNREILISVLEGFLIGFFLPSSFPIPAAFFGVCICLLIFHHLFGSFAAPWANPVALSVIVLYFLSGSSFDFPLTDTTHLTSGNSVLQLIFNGDFVPIENEKAFHDMAEKFFGVKLPDGYVTLFWDTQSPIPAFRFNLLLIFSAVVLIAFGIIDWIIPITFLGVYGVLIKFYASAILWGAYGQGDILLAFFTGGTFFTAFFLLPRNGTIPKTHIGKVLYGVFAGFFAFLISGPGLTGCNACFVVVLANLISTFILFTEERLIFLWVKQLVRLEKRNEK